MIAGGRTKDLDFDLTGLGYGYVFQKYVAMSFVYLNTAESFLDIR